MGENCERTHLNFKMAVEIVNLICTTTVSSSSYKCFILHNFRDLREAR